MRTPPSGPPARRRDRHPKKSFGHLATLTSHIPESFSRVGFSICASGYCTVDGTYLLSPREFKTAEPVIDATLRLHCDQPRIFELHQATAAVTLRKVLPPDSEVADFRVHS